jgi:hypothetical protein
LGFCKVVGQDVEVSEYGQKNVLASFLYELMQEARKELERSVLIPDLAS